jgi:hypothetical protein
MSGGSIARQINISLNERVARICDTSVAVEGRLGPVRQPWQPTRMGSDMTTLTFVFRSALSIGMT